MISRICEEFHCTPLEAAQQPLELTLAVMELRAYAGAKRLVEDPQTKSEDIPESPMVDAVWATVAAIAEERRRGNKRG